MIHDAPLLLATVLFYYSAIRRNIAKARQGSWILFLHPQRGQCLIQACRALRSREFSQKISGGLAYSIAPFRHSIYAVFLIEKGGVQSNGLESLRLGGATEQSAGRGMMMKREKAMSSKQRKFMGQSPKKAYSVRAGRERPPSLFYATRR